MLVEENRALKAENEVLRRKRKVSVSKQAEQSQGAKRPIRGKHFSKRVSVVIVECRYSFARLKSAPFQQHSGFRIGEPRLYNKK